MFYYFYIHICDALITHVCNWIHIGSSKISSTELLLDPVFYAFASFHANKTY